MRPDLTARHAATAIEGPLLFLRRTVEAGLNEAVQVLGPDAEPRLGRVAALDDDTMVVEVLQSMSGLGLDDVRVRFLGEAVAAVAAKSEEIAAEALDKIKVEYEVLPHSLYTAEASLDEAAQLHPPEKNKYLFTNVVQGDVKNGFTKADIVAGLLRATLWLYGL